MGLNDIDQAFAKARSEHRPALMPFWTLGYPTVEMSVQIIKAIAAAGADMIELGIPFSDPLADGVVVQKASQIALENGITMRKGMEIAARVRAEGVTVPLFAMGYLNPLIAYGEQRYVEDWRKAGVDGLIVPDLPPEESGELGALCAQNQMALVQFAAPTSTAARLELAAKYASGFIYVVQVTGVTGARDTLAAGLREYVERVKAKAERKPVVVGFGVSTAAHVREIGTFADGAIVASALLRASFDAADPVQVVSERVRQLRGA